MKLIFPYFLLICVLFSTAIKRSDKKLKENTGNFWQREHDANFTRKKNIDNLDYITLSIEKLPFLENPCEKIADCEKKIKELSTKRIIDLSSFTNTDLKLQYGAANLTALSEYDENFFILTKTFESWGQALVEEGFTSEAKTVLEYGLSLGCETKLIHKTLESI